MKYASIGCHCILQQEIKPIVVALLICNIFVVTVQINSRFLFSLSSLTSSKTVQSKVDCILVSTTPECFLIFDRTVRPKQTALETESCCHVVPWQYFKVLPLNLFKSSSCCPPPKKMHGVDLVLIFQGNIALFLATASDFPLQRLSVQI